MDVTLVINDEHKFGAQTVILSLSSAGFKQILVNERQFLCATRARNILQNILGIPCYTHCDTHTIIYRWLKLVINYMCSVHIV